MRFHSFSDMVKYILDDRGSPNAKKGECAMKRSLSILLAALMLISLLFIPACTASKPVSPKPENADEATANAETPLPETDAPAENPTAEPEPTPEPLGLITEITEDMLDPVVEQIEGFKTAKADAAPLEDIPVYYEQALIYDVPVVVIDYCKAACEYYGSGTMASLQELLLCCPNTAFRKCEGRGYLAYDTETGYRVFVFTDEAHGYKVRTGLPVILRSGSALEYADFSGLSDGDPIDSVCAVDPIAEIYKVKFSEYLEYPDPLFFNRGAERGVFYSSIHYLTDGLLLIEYYMNDAREIVIQGMTYSADRILADRSGDNIDYTILDVDLP